MKSIRPLALTIGAVTVGMTLLAHFTEFNLHGSNDRSTSSISSVVNSSSINNPAANNRVTKEAASTASTQKDNAAQKADLPIASEGNKGVVTEGYTLQARVDQMQARRNGQHFDPDAIKSAVQQPSAWQVDPSVADSLGLDDQERYDGREFIRFSPLKLESLMPGDEMEIPVAQQNATYQMVVDNVQVHDDGNVSWTGHLKDFPLENQVSFTRGKDLTVGSITVPDKQFTLQAHGEMGWVVNSFTLFKGGDEHLFPEEGDEHGGHHHADQHDHES